ncbi:hypothetical protein ACQR0Z_14855 [Bradyrhizobium sp. HKCCYLS3077]|uniref:hypothetical protein n=1 Tax=Bradyrhizobium sp. HKCCYLS3077 TaxID=3420761 RepID=UPI003EB79845
MPEEIRTGEIPEKVRSTLKDNNVNLDDPEVRRIVLLTIRTSGGPSFRTALHAYRRGFLRGLTKEMEKAAETTSRFAARLTSIAIIAGLFSAGSSLVSGFEPFRESLQGLLSVIYKYLKTSSFISSTVYAQSGAPVGIPPAAQLLGPVFVYIVYVLFSIGYVVSLFGLFFGKQPKDKANAMEILRNLTAFFIGAISGKFV